MGWAAMDLMRVADADNDGTLKHEELEGHLGIYRHHFHNEF